MKYEVSIIKAERSITFMAAKRSNAVMRIVIHKHGITFR